jgi:hypothetical protein
MMSPSLRSSILYLARALALGGTIVALIALYPLGSNTSLAVLVITGWVLLPFALTFPAVLVHSAWLPAILASLLGNGFGLFVYGSYLLPTTHKSSTDAIGFMFIPVYQLVPGSISLALFFTGRWLTPLGRCTSCQRYLKPKQTLCAECATRDTKTVAGPAL